MISIETDSHGRTYQIWKQTQMNSCGVAAVWMARGIARQMSFREEEWDLAQRVYRNAVGNALATLGIGSSGPMTLDPRAFPRTQGTMASTIANFGFFATQLATAIRAEGLRAEHVGLNATRTARTIEPHKIAINKPAIALVYWNRGGGHFVVVGRCTRSAVSYLDPWTGRINEQRNDGEYIASYNQGRVGEIIYISA